ncbi:MAG: trypsin-like peptidase domain-containing protein [Chloroflexota bacterium]|nr:trypsin-like peptidase domain-containing protein [Chloroflexota bacterium]
MMRRAWSQLDLAGALLLSLVLASAWACTSANRASSSPTDTAVACTDENAIQTVRRSVVRISTDAAVGTGIVVAENQILTNAHVVENIDKVRVQSQAGAEEGTVVGTDNVVDLALIQAATSALPAVNFANPSSLKPGQRLLAIGYAWTCRASRRQLRESSRRSVRSTVCITCRPMRPSTRATVEDRCSLSVAMSSV